MVPERAFPIDPITAVTFPDPYPFYAELVARGLYRDETLGLWIAASAEAVTAVLASDLCRVRPPAEPVPRALAGSPAGEIFRHLVRMNDGPLHDSCRQAVSAMVEAIGETQAATASRHWAGFLADELQGFHFRLPVYTIASLLRVPPDSVRSAAEWMGDLVPALAPASTSAQVERGQAAARALWELFRSLYEGDAIVANAIGLLFQAHDATAGLIGNTLVALGRHGAVRERVAADPDLLSAVLLEVLRYDPPVQNTRRFVAREGVVAGQRMREGDAVLVVLAAANRDPAANEGPERFDPSRKERRIFTFGAGVHACPGEALALTIARAGVERLLLTGFNLERFAATVTYRPAANVRIPEGLSAGGAPSPERVSSPG